jgi:hypothetical protein
VLAVILLLLAGAPAGAQKAQAVLESGPRPVRGLPFFPANVLAAAKGEYLAQGSRVQVLFTREPLVLPAGWRRVACGREALLRLEEEEKPTFCYPEPDGGFTLFFTFADESFPWCAWTQAFLPRLRSLLTFSQDPAEVPFPAILDYGGG